MTAALLQHPPHRPLILPSILSADFARLGEEVADVIEAGADAIHVDVMDGHFAPNLTMGPAVVRSLRDRFADLFLDVHLMVSEPERFIKPFAQAGADHLSFHVELFAPAGGVRPLDDARRLIEAIHGLDCAAGLAINPPTPVKAASDLLDTVDLALVMSVHPGFSGQSFIPEVLEKTRFLRDRMRDDQRVEMDGGINGATVGRVREAGCDTIVAASYLFGAEDRARAIQTLRGT